MHVYAELGVNCVPAIHRMSIQRATAVRGDPRKVLKKDAKNAVEAHVTADASPVLPAEELHIVNVVSIKILRHL